MSEMDSTMNDGIATVSSSTVAGFESTMNNMGFAATSLDLYCRKFVEFAPTASGPVLEIGAAFGLSSIAALCNGAEVIANDIDVRHLRILMERVPEDRRSSISILQGAAPELDIESASLGAVLISRVMHFFDGFRIQRMFQNAHRWLRPGGKLFVVAETPFQRTVESFIETYEKRKLGGRQWPGLVHDINAYVSNRSGAIPNMVHFLDADVLSREAVKSGFMVEQVEVFPRMDFPEHYRLDGRESVGLVASRPDDAL